jgi:molybdopterin converting factor small subunit
LRPLCDGVSTLDVEPGTLEQVFRALDGRCPGFFDRVVEAGRVRPELAIAMNGEVDTYGLQERVADGIELAIVPALGGGAG